MTARGVIILKGNLNIGGSANKDRVIPQTHDSTRLGTLNNHELRRPRRQGSRSRMRRSRRSKRGLSLIGGSTHITADTKITTSRSQHHKDKKPQQHQKRKAQHRYSNLRRHRLPLSNHQSEHDTGTPHLKDSSTLNFSPAMEPLAIDVRTVR